MAAKFSVGQRLRLSPKGFGVWSSLIADIDESADVTFVVTGVPDDGVGDYEGTFEIRRNGRHVEESGWLADEGDLEVSDDG